MSTTWLYFSNASEVDFNGEQMSSHCWLHPKRFYSPFEHLVKISDILLSLNKVTFEKSESSTNALMPRQERDFPERDFPIWTYLSPFNRDISADRAWNEHLKCAQRL